MATTCGIILIVDDDPGARALMGSLVERIGHVPEEAETGEAALEAVRRQRPLCVLLDVHLPRVSGYEVCRELRDEYGQELPIIFVTGERTEPSDRVAGLLIGADDYVIKPFDPDELIARVRRAISRSRPDAMQAAPWREGFDLTVRERQVLALLAKGLAQQAIATELFISPKTVATHIQRILPKLGVRSRAQAVAVAHREGLVERGPSPATARRP
jgi:DNA-binding NarL/FixJ family response regulator